MHCLAIKVARFTMMGPTRLRKIFSESGGKVDIQDVVSSGRVPEPHVSIRNLHRVVGNDPSRLKDDEGQSILYFLAQPHKGQFLLVEDQVHRPNLGKPEQTLWKSDLVPYLGLTNLRIVGIFSCLQFHGDLMEK